MRRQPSNAPEDEDEEGSDDKVDAARSDAAVAGWDQAATEAHLRPAALDGRLSSDGLSTAAVATPSAREGPTAPSDEIASPAEVSKEGALPPTPKEGRAEVPDMSTLRRWRSRPRSPWSCSFLTLLVTMTAVALLLGSYRSVVSRQRDVPGCRMSYMRPAFAKFNDFDTEHTRFASKYSLYLYREGGVDEDTRVSRGENLYSAKRRGFPCDVRADPGRR